MSTSTTPPAATLDGEIFIAGISGSIGGLLAQRLLAGGVRVRGLVRTAVQRSAWESRGVDVDVGEIADLPVSEFAGMLAGASAIVYAAGSNGGSREVTDAIDGDGVVKAVAAARAARVPRLILVSVMPEAWRERGLDEDEEYYFAAKKRAEVFVTGSDLDWVILRPSLLLDEPGTGQVSLGPAQIHDGISREDVAQTLAELVLENRIRQKILELNAGSTPISDAVRRTIDN